MTTTTNEPYICSHARRAAHAASAAEGDAGGVHFELGFVDAQAAELERRVATLEADIARERAARDILGDLLDALDDARVDACAELRAKASAIIWIAIRGGN